MTKSKRGSSKIGNTLAYSIGIIGLSAGGYFLYKHFKSTGGPPGTGTVTVTVLDNGAQAPFATISSSPGGISGNTNSAGVLTVYNVPYGSYTITASYGSLSQTGSLTVQNPSSNPITIDVAPSASIAITVSAGTANIAGINALYTVTGAGSPSTPVNLTGTARNSVGQTIGIGVFQWPAVNGSTFVFVPFSNQIPTGTYQFQIQITSTNGSAIGQPYIFSASV